MKEAKTLDRLGGGIGSVAGEEQPIPGLDLVGKSHKDARVQGQSWKRSRISISGRLIYIGKGTGQIISKICHNFHYIMCIWSRWHLIPMESDYGVKWTNCA